MKCEGLKIKDFGCKRPKTIKVLLTEVVTTESEWGKGEGLLFPATAQRMLPRLRQLLSQAREFCVDLLILPELSVPAECLPLLQRASRETGMIIIAGTHYHSDRHGRVAECPIFISGKLFNTQKLNPAPVEKSPISLHSDNAIHSGNTVRVFRNTSIGNFAVLICSDYLKQALKSRVLDSIPEALDILCVVAFQKDSQRYHGRMSIDCEDSARGLYIAYANMRCEKLADGRSAVFGQMHRQFRTKLIQEHYTSESEPQKLIEMPRTADYLIFELDLQNKRPYATPHPADEPNLRLEKVGAIATPDDLLSLSETITDKSLETFLKSAPIIARIDRKIREAIDKPILSAKPFIATFVQRLAYVQIGTLKQLTVALESDENIVERCAIAWFKHPDGRRTSIIPTGVSISFLSVVLIMREKGGLPALKEFWRRFRFNRESDPDEIARVMGHIYLLQRRLLARRVTSKGVLLRKS